VIPEFIFHATLGELFVVRVAGNIAVDETVINSLEYSICHLKVSHLIILGHTDCGAIKAAEEAPDDESRLIKEIRTSFDLDPNNHEKANLLHQLSKLPKRSHVISEAISDGTVQLLGAIYHLEDGQVEFIEKPLREADQIIG
jgi:carbonic anhydrase